MAREHRKISSPLGCAHQLPRISFPAMASARLGTGPRPDSRTTPLVFTKVRACFGVISTLARCRLKHQGSAARRFSGESAAPELGAIPEGLKQTSPNPCPSALGALGHRLGTRFP